MEKRDRPIVFSSADYRSSRGETRDPFELSKFTFPREIAKTIGSPFRCKINEYIHSRIATLKYKKQWCKICLGINI